MQLPAGSELKVPVCNREQYVLLLERWDNRTWIHCNVSRWGPQAERQLKADLALLRDMIGHSFFATHKVGDEKHYKFLTRLGFKERGVLTSEYAVYEYGGSYGD